MSRCFPPVPELNRGQEVEKRKKASQRIFPGSHVLTFPAQGTNLGNKIMGVKEFSRLDDGVEVPLNSNQKVAFLDTEGHGDQGDLYEFVAPFPSLFCL